MRLTDKFKSLRQSDSFEFLKHSGNYLSGSIIQNILVAAALPILSRLLSPDDYGVLSIFSSLVAMLTIIFGLDIRGGIVRYYLEKNDDFDKALGANLIFLAGFNIVILGVLILYSDALASFFAIDADVFFFSSLVAVLSVSTEIYLNYLQGSKRSGLNSVLTVLRTGAVLGIAIIVILQMDERRYLGKIYAELAVSGLLALVACGALLRVARFSIDWKYIRYTLRFSIPLIPHALSRFALGYFDRIIIKQLGTAAETGIYSFAYDCAMAMDVVVMATVKAWRPIFFDEYREENLEKINRIVKDYSRYIYLAAIGIILFLGDLVMLVADNRFFPALRLIPVIVLGYVFVFLYTLYFQYSAYRKRTELISITTIFAGVVNIVLNYWLIPIYGYEVAALTTLVSYMLLFVFHYTNARFVLKERVISLGLLLPQFIIVFVIAAICIALSIFVESRLIALGPKLLIGLWALYHFLLKKRPQTQRP